LKGRVRVLRGQKEERELALFNYEENRDEDLAELVNLRKNWVVAPTTSKPHEGAGVAVPRPVKPLHLFCFL
jgi:hypothetical protein